MDQIRKALREHADNFDAHMDKGLAKIDVRRARIWPCLTSMCTGMWPGWTTHRRKHLARTLLPLRRETCRWQKIDDEWKKRVAREDEHSIKQIRVFEFFGAETGLGSHGSEGKEGEERVRPVLLQLRRAVQAAEVFICNHYTHLARLHTRIFSRACGSRLIAAFCARHLETIITQLACNVQYTT